MLKMSILILWEYNLIKRIGVTYMHALELTGTITAIANALACKLTVDEMGLLASILVQLGDTLATISLTESLCKSEKESENVKS